MYTCKICGNATSNKSYIAREMMFGYRDEFEYIECAKCGCLQIKQVPDNLEKYYPENYYSFRKRQNGSCVRVLKFLVTSQTVNYCLLGRNIIGLLLSKVFGVPEYCEWIKKAKVYMDSKILDVGCGIGELLISLYQHGFCNLAGIDPYLNEDIFYENGVKIFKMGIHEMEGQFDFIMLHHSFEHMSEPLFVFRELYRLLKPCRFALIRIPVSSSFAWRQYGVNWGQLDAPRHLFLHTPISIQILAEQAALKVANTTYDSTEYQFWSSEQYLRDIPLRDKRSYAENPRKSIFSRKEIRAFKTRTIELNKNKEGDSACFYLYKE